MEKNKKKAGFRDYLLYFIVSFGMLVLTSSFVVEDVYNYADRIRMTPEGIKVIYQISVDNLEADSIMELQ